MQFFGDVFDRRATVDRPVTPMTNAARCSYNTRLAGWMSAPGRHRHLRVPPFGAYERLPIVVPISFEDGNPHAVSPPSPPGWSTCPSACNWRSGWCSPPSWLWSSAGGTSDAAGTDQQRRAVAEHTAEGVALLAAVWIAFQAVNAWRLTELWRRTFDPFVELYVLALLTAFTVSVVIGLRVVVKVQEAGAGDRLLHTPVLDGRRRLATAGLAALLALGIGAPLVLLSMVWDLLKQYS